MIDFRYHLVSIVAVFLALAIGIVVGASAIKPGVLNVLDHASNSELHQIASQRTTIKNQQDQLGTSETFAQSRWTNAGAPATIGSDFANARVGSRRLAA